MSARAAAMAYAPPDPMPITPSSGSIRSPVPERRYISFGVGDEQHRFETPQHAVGAPVARQFDGGALEVAAVLLQLALEPGEEREAVGRPAGEPRQHAVVIEPAHLLRAVLDDGLAERDLTVTGHDDLALMTDGKHGRGVDLRHLHSFAS